MNNRLSAIIDGTITINTNHSINPYPIYVDTRYNIILVNKDSFDTRDCTIEYRKNDRIATFNNYRKSDNDHDATIVCHRNSSGYSHNDPIGNGKGYGGGYRKYSGGCRRK